MTDCGPGHVWEDATYRTISVQIDITPRPGPWFLQHRACQRCGHQITHVRDLTGGEPTSIYEAVRMLAAAR